MDGKWTYTEGTDTTDITEVSCLLQVAPPACATCTIDQITLTPMSSATTTTPFPRGPSTNGDGCLEVTIVCTPNTAGGSVLMKFNGGGGGPQLSIGSEATATLSCVDGQWMYSENGIDTIIMEVNCVAT